MYSSGEMSSVLVLEMGVGGLLADMSVRTWFEAGDLVGEWVGRTGRSDVVMGLIPAAGPGPSVATVLDCCMVLPGFADVGLGLALDDGGLESCFLGFGFGFGFARLVDFFAAFWGVSSIVIISLGAFRHGGSLAKGSSLLGGINWVSVSGAVAGRSEPLSGALEDGNRWPEDAVARSSMFGLGRRPVDPAVVRPRVALSNVSNGLGKVWR